jgi:hypothetical protein
MLQASPQLRKPGMRLRRTLSYPAILPSGPMHITPGQRRSPVTGRSDLPIPEDSQVCGITPLAGTTPDKRDPVHTPRRVTSLTPLRAAATHREHGSALLITPSPPPSAAARKGIDAATPRSTMRHIRESRHKWPSTCENSTKRTPGPPPARHAPSILYDYVRY